MPLSLSALSLSAPAPTDRDELLAFEQTNRTYFESWINARSPDYYSPSGVADAIESAQRDAAADTAYQFLIREQGVLVGRVNLTQIRRAHFHSAVLGYRIGEAHGRRGLAKAAVGLALEQAFGDLALSRIEATSRPENVGSVTVLLANGFHQFGHSRRSLCLGDTWYDLLYFEAHAT